MNRHIFKTKILTGLTASIADGEHFEPHGTLQHVAHFPHDGVVCQLKLGSAGLQYHRGEESAVIPHEELVALFESLHPKFAERPNHLAAVPPAMPEDARPEVEE